MAISDCKRWLKFHISNPEMAVNTVVSGGSGPQNTLFSEVRLEGAIVMFRALFDLESDPDPGPSY